MRKALLTALILTCLFATQSYAKNSPKEDINVSSSNSGKINDIMREIEAAASAGDEQLVSKLLIIAIKSNPDLADQIITAFVNDPVLSAISSKSNTINTNAIINNVISALQAQPGNEALVASILNAYTPAAGTNTANKSGNVPSLLPTNKAGNNSSLTLPKENPNQTSAN